MNYKLHYNKLIERAKDRIIEGYTEKHHIVPKSIGGLDDKDNLVKLTAREHFIAHILLVKIYPKEYGLIKAVNMMCIGQDERKAETKNRMYGWLRGKFALEMSRSQSGAGNSQFGKKWITKNQDNKMILAENLDRYILDGWKTGRYVEGQKNNICENCGKETLNKTYCQMSCRTEAEKQFNECKKCGKKVSGRIYCSKECRILNKKPGYIKRGYSKTSSFGMKGKKHSEETKIKMSNALKEKHLAIKT